MCGVKLSVKSDYAVRAVLGLARQYTKGDAMKAEELAAQYSIPPNYLVQILIELKAHNIVKSVRGKEGGYLLSRAPAEITFADILRCIHGQVFDTPALHDAGCPSELRRAWQQLQQKLNEAAEAITFQRLLEDSTAKMYYI